MFQARRTEAEEMIDVLFSHFEDEVLIEAFLRKWNIHNILFDITDRLKQVKKKRSRNALSRGLRRTLIKRLDQDCCIYCGKHLEEGDYEIDHFLAINVALEAGDDIIDNLYNLFLACKACNRQKHDSKYSFMYDDVIAQRKDYLYEIFNDLWLTKSGRFALKRLFKIYDETKGEVRGINTEKARESISE